MRLNFILTLLVLIVSVADARYRHHHYRHRHYHKYHKHYKYRDCRSDYMYDPCPLGSYSVVETEKYVRGRHNWMKIGDTLDTDIITGGIGSEPHRNLRRDEYQFPCESTKYFDRRGRVVVKSNCDSYQECKM